MKVQKSKHGVRRPYEDAMCYNNILDVGLLQITEAAFLATCRQQRLVGPFIEKL